MKWARKNQNQTKRFWLRKWSLNKPILEKAIPPQLLSKHSLTKLKFNSFLFG